MPQFEILRADTSALRQAAFRFRYDIYVSRMKRRQAGADHDSQQVEEDLDATGRIFLALREGRVVGTVRGNMADEACMAYYVKLYRLDRFRLADLGKVQITTKLMIAPEYAGSSLAPKLISAYAAEGYRLGVNVDFIDCNKPLIPFFERMGYFSYCGWVFHKEYGTVRPMFFPVDTVSYLDDVGSFLRIPARAALHDGQYDGYQLIQRHAERPRAHLAGMAYDRVLAHR